MKGTYLLKKKRRLCLLAASLASFLLVSGTLAAWAVEDPAINIISTGELKGELREIYSPPASVSPGTVVDKVVNVANVGDVDMLARIKLEKAWGSSRDSMGNLIRTDEDLTLSTNNIQIETNTTYWMYDDGYYYYKGILRKNQTTLEPLFEEFTLAEETGNIYKRKQADIVVSLECIQAGGNAVSVWNKTYEQLGVTAPVAPTSRNTTVSFISPDKKFSFDPITTDLFMNFKNLVPGESRIQEVKVENQYSQAVEILLRADYTAQRDMSPEKLALTKDMLERYATVEITNRDNGDVIYNGAVWGNYPNEPSGVDSMKNNISLGNFDENASRNLNVELTLNPDMGNEYQGLWGNIKWVFVARGEDPDKGPGENPDEEPGEEPGGNPGGMLPGPGGGGSDGDGTGTSSGDSDDVDTDDSSGQSGGSGTFFIAESDVPLATINDMPLPKTGVDGTTVLWVTGLVASAWIFGLLIVPLAKRKKKENTGR